jgi:hypothetical protein
MFFGKWGSIYIYKHMSCIYIWCSGTVQLSEGDLWCQEFQKEYTSMDRKRNNRQSVQLGTGPAAKYNAALVHTSMRCKNLHCSRSSSISRSANALFPGQVGEANLPAEQRDSCGVRRTIWEAARWTKIPWMCKSLAVFWSDKSRSHTCNGGSRRAYAVCDQRDKTETVALILGKVLEWYFCIGPARRQKYAGPPKRACSEQKDTDTTSVVISTGAQHAGKLTLAFAQVCWRSVDVKAL